MAQHIVDNHLKVSNYAELYETLYAVEARLHDESRITYGKDLERHNAAPETHPEPSINDYFFQIQSDPKSAAARRDRWEITLGALEESEEYEGLLLWGGNATPNDVAAK